VSADAARAARIAAANTPADAEEKLAIVQAALISVIEITIPNLAMKSPVRIPSCAFPMRSDSSSKRHIRADQKCGLESEAGWRAGPAGPAFPGWLSFELPGWQGG
jgi:hypothetical protein